MRKGVTGKVGHYTQIVWAETYKIGCGYIMYKKGKKFNKVWYQMNRKFVIIILKRTISCEIILSIFKVLVCNYGPGGNEAGGSMYKIGRAGSLCSNGSENGLCL